MAKLPKYYIYQNASGKDANASTMITATAKAKKLAKSDRDGIAYIMDRYARTTKKIVNR